MQVCPTMLLDAEKRLPCLVRLAVLLAVLQLDLVLLQMDGAELVLVLGLLLDYLVAQELLVLELRL